MFRLACYGKNLSCVLLVPMSSLALESSTSLNYMNTSASSEVTAEVGARDHGQEENGAIFMASMSHSFPEFFVMPLKYT